MVPYHLAGGFTLYHIFDGQNVVNQLMFQFPTNYGASNIPSGAGFWCCKPMKTRLGFVSESKLPCGGSVAMHGNRCTRQLVGENCQCWEVERATKMGRYLTKFDVAAFFFLNYAFFESFQKMAFQIFLLSLVAALIVCHRQVRWLLQQPGFIKVTNSFKMKRVFGLMKIIETIWNHLSWMPPSHPVPPWLYWL